MKFNLYIPYKTILDDWNIYARTEDRSLSQFIRHAVDSYIMNTYHDQIRGTE